VLVNGLTRTDPFAVYQLRVRPAESRHSLPGESVVGVGLQNSPKLRRGVCQVSSDPLGLSRRNRESPFCCLASRQYLLEEPFEADPAGYGQVRYAAGTR
jgi:hypothetical protein